MPKVKLTDAAVQRFKAPQGQRIDYFDATLPGFALRVSGPTERSPEGRKSWVLFYWFRGKQKRLTLEPVYPALKLGEARRRAGVALDQVAEGIDPSETKAASKRASDDTVEKMIEEFIKRRLTAKGRAPRYIEETKRNFDNHVLPRWAGRDIKTITRRDINELLDGVADEGTTIKDDNGVKRHAPGGQIAANRVLAAVRALFNWTLSRGVIESTPAAQIEPRGEETQRDRTLTVDEVAFLWAQFDARGYPFGSFFRMALVTGQRRDEVAGMRWAEIDEAERTWTLPGERTKSGRPHVVPLPDVALQILAQAKEELAMIAKAKGQKSIGEFVFSTTLDAPISGFSRAKAKLDRDSAEARAKDKLKPLEPWTIHDLRRTVATQLAELGVSRFVISRVLNHADRAVTGIYDRHTYLPEMRHALDTWGQRLSGIITGAPSTNVIPLEKSAKRRARAGGRP